jgi:hypothetical protein
MEWSRNRSPCPVVTTWRCIADMQFCTKANCCQEMLFDRICLDTNVTHKDEP